MKCHFSWPISDRCLLDCKMARTVSWVRPMKRTRAPIKQIRWDGKSNAKSLIVLTWLWIKRECDSHDKVGNKNQQRAPKAQTYSNAGWRAIKRFSAAPSTDPEWAQSQNSANLVSEEFRENHTLKAVKVHIKSTVNGWPKTLRWRR